MSSSRNAPEWFGGGAKPAKRPDTSKSSSRPSSNNNSRRNQSSRRNDAPSTTNERRKKSSHKRKKSRDSLPETHDSAQDLNSSNHRDRVVPFETSPKRSTEISSKERNERKQSSAQRRGRSPSFVERLFGFASGKNDEPPEKEMLQLEQARPGQVDRRTSVGSTHSDPSESSPRKRSNSSSAKSRNHRRTYSDPIDANHISSMQSPPYHNSVTPRESEYVTADEENVQAQPPSPPPPPAALPKMTSQGTVYRPNNIVYGEGDLSITPRFNNKSVQGSTPVDYSGAESDDPLVYSEDESTSAQSMRFPLQPPSMMGNQYPYAGPYGDHQNRESLEMMEHHQMMALHAPNRQGPVFVKESQSYPHPQYGSLVGQAQQFPGNFAPQRSKTPPANEFYISEDDTLLSESSKSLNSRGSFSRIQTMYAQNLKKMFHISEEKEKHESSPLLSPKLVSSNGSNNSSGVGNVSGGGSGSGSGGSNHSGGRKVRISPAAPGVSSASSHSSGSGSNKHTNPLHSPLSRRDSPPPPIKSVSIQHSRTVSNGTSTTASNSVNYSPHGILRSVHQQHVSHSTLHPQKTRSGLSRRELKRLARKLDICEMKEDRIQSIIRSGHNDALDWSQHVKQEVRGLNRPAGFFPHEKQKIHDLIFALVFIFQMATVLYIGFRFSGETTMDRLNISSFENGYSAPSESVQDNGNLYPIDPFSTGSTIPDDRQSTLSNWAKDIHVDYSNALQLACITALYATSLSALFIGMMMILGKALIPTVLCLTVIVCIAFGTIGIALNPYSCFPIVGVILLAVSLGYSIVVWDRIPFAATNLDTALCGVKCSADVLFVGLVMMVCSFFWTIGWSVAFLGIYDHYLDKIASENDYSNSVTVVGLIVYLAMFISYFWTLNVMKNIIHVTIAGVVATWWSDPESLTTHCSNILRKEFIVSLTSSFGSICLGSLIAPSLEILRNSLGMCCNSISNQPQQLGSNSTHDNGKLGDQSVYSDPTNLAQLPVPKSPIDGAIKYFNDYGFTYMGIYRESFHTSSRKATEVFETREWVGVISDKLIDTVLCFISFAVTLGSGCFGLVVEEFDGYNFTNFQKPTSTAFFIGCAIGWVVSSVCLKVISSSVRTVLVCFSLAPWKFHVNHPVLSREMRASWGGIWLDEYDWLNVDEEAVDQREVF